ncbi:helix-turn-helix domain-containing protein [Streptomyces sp. NPDC014983]|uniref:helix-turn-helix domain-containing protein n=1 Tax=Streptomyces sp. NPDC014983 TaxID=3364933 RepID=UPI0036F94E39
MSVRTVTYRLNRIRQLTGHDPGDPDQRYVLQTAALGARLLDWPSHPPATLRVIHHVLTGRSTTRMAFRGGRCGERMRRTCHSLT